MTVTVWTSHRGTQRVHRLTTVDPDVDATRDEVGQLATEGPAEFDVRSAYDAFGGELLGFVLNGVGDRAAAEDCVQDIFVKAWRARERYDGRRSSLRTWLYAIARNVVVDHHRATARRPRVVGDDALATVAAPGDSVSDLEERLVLYEALARLSPEHREVIVAVQLDGLDYAELSRRTGVAVTTLRTRMYYGLRALREILGEEERHG